MKWSLLSQNSTAQGTGVEFGAPTGSLSSVEVPMLCLFPWGWNSVLDLPWRRHLPRVRVRILHVTQGYFHEE